MKKLLKENPDAVETSGLRLTYTDKDSITFIIDKVTGSVFWIFATQGNDPTHEAIRKILKGYGFLKRNLKNPAEIDKLYTKTSEKLTCNVKMAPDGEFVKKPIVKPGSPPFRKYFVLPASSLSDVSVYYDGDIDGNVKKIWVTDDLKTARDFVDSETGIISGRFWTKSSIVSFWNKQKDVANHIDKIEKFLEKFHKTPSQIQYEPIDSNKLLKKEELTSTDQNLKTPSQIKIDRAKLHGLGAMLPSGYGNALKKLEESTKLKDIIRKSNILK